MQLFKQKDAVVLLKDAVVLLKDAADKTPMGVESYFCNTRISIVKTVAMLEIRVLVSRYLLFLLVPQTHHLSFDLYSPLCISLFVFPTLSP